MNAKELLSDQTSTDEMSVAEWLRRLNMSKYSAAFSEKKVYFVTDLRHFTDPRCFNETFGEIIKERGDSNRITQMMAMEKKIIEDF